MLSTTLLMEYTYIQEVDGSLFNLARLKSKTLVRKVLVRELLFADDAALVSHTEEGLQCLLSKFADACKEFGLTISIKKTSDGPEHHNYTHSTIGRSAL